MSLASAQDYAGQLAFSDGCVDFVTFGAYSGELSDLLRRNRDFTTGWTSVP
jgi:hypothetical protein